MGTVALKQRIRVTEPASIPSIAFRHPGYERDNVLLQLPRFDSAGPGSPAGVHHATALLACQIIANNAFNGYFTNCDGQRIAVAADGILVDADYWFVVPGYQRPAAYPVVPRFEDWQFPHDHLGRLPAWDTMPQRPESQSTELRTQDVSSPTAWDRSMPPPASTSMCTSTTAPTSQCILSGSGWASEKEHIIPAAQRQWFMANEMKQYVQEETSFIDDEQNQAYIRSDLHKLWDNYIFAFVPKWDGSNFVFVAHVLNRSKPWISYLASEWHNMPVQNGSFPGGKAFLLAKFAQAIFMLFKGFVAFPAVSRRNIATLQIRADDSTSGFVEIQTEWVSAADLSQRYGGGGSRSASASSRKRSRSQVSAGEDNESDDGNWYVRNVRARAGRGRSICDEEGARWYVLNMLGLDPDLDKELEEDRRRRKRQRVWDVDDQEEEEEEEERWFRLGLLDKDPAGGRVSKGEHDGPDIAEVREWGEERGRPRVRWQIQPDARSDHTVDTLPTLTDTSVAAHDLEDMERSGFLQVASSLQAPASLEDKEAVVMEGGTCKQEAPLL